MTGDRTRAVVEGLRERLFTVNGIIAMAVLLVLIIGFFLGSPVGRIICAVIFVLGTVYLFLVGRRGRDISVGGREEHKEEMYSQSPEGSMKKLLFDDFQSTGDGKYVVKEVVEEEKIVPSTKSAQPVAITKEDKVREFQISDFFDLDSDIFRSETEPRSEFSFLLGKVLLALKEMLFAHTVAFFWANRDKNQMVLEARVTDSRNFMARKRFPIEDDVVSQVANTGKPQILGRVNPSAEKELICYYESPESIKSFLGVPVFFLRTSNDALPVGVIVADSKAEDAFGPETLGLIGNFTKLASALIKGYTDKYDLLLDSELLNSIRRLQDRIRSDPSEYTILNSLAEELNRLVNWDFLTVTMYNEERRGWVLQKVVNKAGEHYVSPDDTVDFNESIVGRVIKTNRLELVDDLGREEPMRFRNDEKIDTSGSFLCVPISSINRCYGALTLESRNKSNFAGVESETTYRLVENAACLLEILYVNDLVKDFVIVDQLTGSFTKKHFVKKIEEEVRRADDFDTELALVSVAVDNMQEHVNRYGREGFDSILSQVAKLIRTNIRPYDVLGRQDVDRLGVLLVNTAASEGYLWAEKVRKQIASHIISMEGRSISVTVSAGVCGMVEGMRKDELLAGTMQVLGKAMENGGNLVRVF